MFSVSIYILLKYCLVLSKLNHKGTWCWGIKKTVDLIQNIVNGCTFVLTMYQRLSDQQYVVY